MSTEPLVRISGLSKSYRQGTAAVPALTDIDLEIHAGEFTALVGPSGSGKTTLLNLIGVLDTPTAGELWIGGRKLSALSRSAAADLRLKRMGFIFQDYSLLPVLSAVENVEYVLLLQGLRPAERRKIALEALQAVGLKGLENRRPTALSGGQQQRVAVARAIAAKPLLVLADEPTANLDSATGAALIETMLGLNREHGVTFVFSTHDEMVTRHARRVIRLKDGRMVDGGHVAKVEAHRAPVERSANATC